MVVIFPIADDHKQATASFKSLMIPTLKQERQK